MEIWNVFIIFEGFYLSHKCSLDLITEYWIIRHFVILLLWKQKTGDITYSLIFFKKIEPNHKTTHPLFHSSPIKCGILLHSVYSRVLFCLLYYMFLTLAYGVITLVVPAPAKSSIMSPAQFRTQCVLNWKCIVKSAHIAKIANIKSFSEFSRKPFWQLLQKILWLPF